MLGRTMHPLKWAKQQGARHELSAPERQLLTAYADHANARGEAFPSMDTLTGETALGRSTIYRARGRLEKLGLLLRGVRDNGAECFLLPAESRSEKGAGSASRSGTDSSQSGNRSTSKRNPSETPARVPESLARVVAALERVAEAKGTHVDVRAILEVCLQFRDRDLQDQAERFEAWLLTGEGENVQIRTLAGLWRRWLERAPRRAARARPAPVADSDHSQYDSTTKEVGT
jgi:hypothetical protein